MGYAYLLLKYYTAFVFDAFKLKFGKNFQIEEFFNLQRELNVIKSFFDPFTSNLKSVSILFGYVARLPVFKH